MGRSQDIHIGDGALWSTVRTAWQTGDYATAIATLQNSQLTDKFFGANTMNFMMDLLVDTQEKNDPTFKANLIQVSSTPPVSGGGNLITSDNNNFITSDGYNFIVKYVSFEVGDIYFKIV